MRSATSPSPQTASAYSLATKPSGLQPRALEPPRQQHAERLVREPALERIADEIILVGAREGLDQQVALARAAASAIAGCRSHSRTCSGSARQCCRIGQDAAHAVGEIGRERKLAALVGRHLRIFGRWSARHRPRPRPAPRICRISPANTKVSPGVSVSMKYSSTSPSTRPPRAIGPVWPLPPARERTRRTLSMSASTMVPTFMR